MRIGLVCAYSLTTPGGVQGQVLGLSRALRAAGHDVRLLGPCDGAPPDPAVIPLGNSVPVEANGSIASLAPDPAAQLRTIRALWDEAFDVVNLHEPLAPGPTLTTLFVEDAPLVGTFHAAGTSSSYRLFGSSLRLVADRLAVRCAVSRDARDLAGAVLGGTWELLFNGVEVERYAKATPWPTDRPTIFFVGRHEPRKGLHQLLQAVTLLEDDVSVWVAGTGPQTEELQRQVGGDPRIEWLGRIADEEKFSRMAGADVFCAPSLGGESFGVVLLEAMAAGTAVVASDLPGYRNAARPGTDALLSTPGDVEALARGLRRALREPGLAEDLVGAGEQRAESFAMDRLAERYLDIFERCQAQRRPRPRRGFGALRARLTRQPFPAA
ncbi:MAG: glycosyltransferase [Acidimicrobiia bacterium]|nr:glycosyltransferase [Acidimicrobiia bacterium]